jgi:hypothetical protein
MIVVWVEFDDPKVKPGAQALLPPHEPTGARFVGRDRISDRVPVIDVGVLALDRVVYLFARRTHVSLGCIELEVTDEPNSNVYGR